MQASQADASGGNNLRESNAEREREKEGIAFLASERVALFGKRRGGGSGGSEFPRDRRRGKKREKRGLFGTQAVKVKKRRSGNGKKKEKKRKSRNLFQNLDWRTFP